MGSGFAISDKSVSALGQAFAGAAALGEDPSALYNNPALLTSLEGSQLALGLNLISIHGDYHDEGSSTTGNADKEITQTALLPSIYYVSELSPSLRAGIGLYVPFGMGLEYDETWHGRYHSVESLLRTVNVSPALAWAPSEQLSLGASIDVAYADAKLRQAVDFGSICVALQIQGGASLPQALSNCAAIGLTPQGSDGFQTLSGDNWSYSASLGGALQFNEGRSRGGVVWHGPVSHTIKGSSEFENVPAAFATSFTDSGGEVSITLPESVSVSLAHATSERLTLLADYTWTRWSRFDELRVSFDNGLPDAVTQQQWNNAARYSAGLNYRLSPEWLLRAGYALDKTPVPSAELRSPRIPDMDRNWYTVGVKWQASAGFALDGSYAYVSGNNTAINNTDSLGHTLKGSYNALMGHYVSVQGTWRF
jgi:long-chain fatty acid transport protein